MTKQLKTIKECFDGINVRHPLARIINVKDPEKVGKIERYRKELDIVMVISFFGTFMISFLAAYGTFRLLHPSFGFHLPLFMALLIMFITTTLLTVLSENAEKYHVLEFLNKNRIMGGEK